MYPTLWLLVWVSVTMVGLASTEQPKNVLFIMADDLRPEIATFKEKGDSMFPGMLTPHLDNFASESIVLTRAYTPQALCCPSRTSLMTGRRPDTTKIYNEGYWRVEGGNFTTLPQHFKNNGYASIGMGKIYHPGVEAGDDDPYSWSEPYYHSPNKKKYASTTDSWKAVSEKRMINFPLPDQQLAENADKTLGRVAADALSGKQPFFLALGFYKPHLPFTFPEAYLDMYPEQDVKLAENSWVPENLPEKAWSSYDELRKYDDITATGDFNTSLDNTKAFELRRAYYATVSFVDKLFGDVLQSLDDHGLADSTIVVFTSDHGWQLGEHAEWAKQTNFELSVRTPVMIRIPGKTDVDTSSVDARDDLVELVDLFPTVVDAAGLDSVNTCPEDSTDIMLCHEGTSLMPLLDRSANEWRDAAFSWYHRDNGVTMGYTMRTAQYRYTEWVQFKRNTWTPVWTNLYGRELYDHDSDPEENYNVADDKVNEDIVTELSARLHKGWRASLPGANVTSWSYDDTPGRKNSGNIHDTHGIILLLIGINGVIFIASSVVGNR